NADVVAWREGFVERLEALGAQVGVHVKLDSGMGRNGTRDAEEALRVARRAAEGRSVRLAGATTHFATADEDPEFVREQLSRFLPFGEGVRALAPDALVHAANSAATLTQPEARLDMVRCGVALYGLDPFQGDPAEHGL